MNFTEQMFAIGVSAFVLTSILGYAILKFFPQWGLMDRPHKYGLNRAPIPYYGGLAISLTFIVGVLFFLPLDRGIIGLLVALLLLMVTSFLDDYLSLSPYLRLFLQVVAGLIMVYSGIGVHSITNPFGEPVSLDRLKYFFLNHEILVLSAVFSVVWIVLMVNSMNFLDGVPGLVSGISFLAALTIFLLSIRTGNKVDQTEVSYMSLILAGSTLAFVFFDFPPPKMLMGDSGSVILGFLVAVLAIFSGGKIATAFLVLGFPLLDLFFTVIRRIVKGQSPFKGDLAHLHHRFLRAGFSERKVVMILYFVSALFGGAALFLGTHEKAIALGVLAAIMAGVLGVLFFVTRKRPQ